MRRDRAVLFACAFAFWAALPAACSNTPSLVGAGGQCLTATDCEPGLVCIPSKGTSTCSNDLAGIQTTEAVDGGVPQEATALPQPEGGGVQPQDSGGTTPTDSGTTPVDSGSKPDTGSPVDADTG